MNCGYEKTKPKLGRWSYCHDRVMDGSGMTNLLGRLDFRLGDGRVSGVLGLAGGSGLAGRVSLGRGPQSLQND